MSTRLEKVKEEIVCIAQFVALEGKENDLLISLHKLIAVTHKEEGCIRYELNQNITKPEMITFVEKWADMDIFNAHCAMPYIKDYFENIAPQLVKKQDVSLHKEIIP